MATSSAFTVTFLFICWRLAAEAISRPSKGVSQCDNPVAPDRTSSILQLGLRVDVSAGLGCCPTPDGINLGCCVGSDESACCPTSDGIILDCCKNPTPSPATPTPPEPPQVAGRGCCPTPDGINLGCCVGSDESACCPTSNGINLDCCKNPAPSPATPTPGAGERQCLGNDTIIPCVGSTCFKIRGNTECVDGKCVCMDEGECFMQSDLLFPLFRPAVCMQRDSTRRDSDSGAQVNFDTVLDFSFIPFRALCFGREESHALFASSAVGPWKKTRMERLKTGDFVLAITELEQPFVDRIWKTLHLADASQHELLEIVHETGSLSVTPDHVLLIDNDFKAARHIRVGSSVSVIGTFFEGGRMRNVTQAKVQKIVFKRGRIVNPVTHSGLIVALGSSDETGMLATTTVDSPQQAMLGAVHWFHVGKLASYMFPQAFQRSRVVEFVMIVGGGILTAMPARVALCISICLDCSFGAYFIFMSLLRKWDVCLLIAALVASIRVCRSSPRSASSCPSLCTSRNPGLQRAGETQLGA